MECTAEFENPLFETQVKEIPTHTEHDWDEPAYEWLGDDKDGYYYVHASRKCKKGHNHVEEEFVEVKKYIKTGDDGKEYTEYIAVFTNKAFETVTKKVHDTESEGRIGDVNGDNEINSKDVTILRRYLAGGWNVEINPETADVNKDGEINSKDVTILRRYLAGGWGIEL